MQDVSSKKEITFVERQLLIYFGCSLTAAPHRYFELKEIIYDRSSQRTEKFIALIDAMIDIVNGKINSTQMQKEAKKYLNFESEPFKIKYR